jgi:hypothetical protein
MTAQPRVWYKARLLPAAQSIFTEGFYPEANRAGTQYVYFTQADVTPTNQKVLIASRLAENSFRMLTLELAQHCLEPKEKATRLEIEQLNKLSQHLDKNV